MKKVIGYLLAGFMVVTILGCEELLDSIESDELTTDDIVEGLKKALEVGTDSASANLSAVNAFYQNPVLKIPLPPEAEQLRALITNNGLSQYLDLDKQFENVVLSVNRAAEEAAGEAAPIFKTAITDLSVTHAIDILNGQVPANLKSAGAVFDSTAATGYFKIKTYDPLTNLFAPKINAKLDQDLGLGFSANQAWITLVTTYNSAYNTINSNFLTNWVIDTYNLPEGIEADLGVFCTTRALDGLFLKVGEEEVKIRRDPYQWAVDILQRVFGSVMEE
ncbi:MAG: DUF4197 domain-containing protein, partial [Bacteroidota bacterium]